MNTQEAPATGEDRAVKRHESLIMEDLLDNLIDEQAFGWLIRRIDEDRLKTDPLYVYRTHLFAIYVDYSDQSVFVSAELGCHPPDEKLSLIDFYNTLKDNAPDSEPDAGEAVRYGDSISMFVYNKKF